MKSVLIVDDNEQILYMLRVLLEGHDYTVLSASNGEEALQVARKNLVDIIISDIMMPVMDGFRLCREWMGDERLQNIPFVFYSATYTDTQDEEFALSLGAARFIVKPAEPDEFMKIIQGVATDLGEGKIVPGTPESRAGEEVLRLYDERLVNKLEKKTLELEEEIAHRKEIEQEIRAKETEQTEILDFMADAVITIDATGNILSFNNTAETLFGFSAEEIIGENINRLMPEPDCSKHDQYLQHYLTTGEEHIIGYGREVVGQHRGDQSFPMRLSVTELPTDKTGKRRFIGTCHDLTQTRQQEEQLRRSEKMDALGKLTGGVAHDYNNMLGVVIGYAQILEDELADQPELAKYVREIRHAGDRGAKLTKKLLAFSKQDALEAAKVDINKLLQQQQDMLQKFLTVRIKVIFDLDDEVWPIWLDSSDLEDAILNMSINAMHAMTDKDSGAQLTVHTLNRSLSTLDAQALGLKAGDYVQLSLTDTGIGIDATIKDQIFDPFFSTKGEAGTGLGLSQVFGFVKRAGGVIKVFSEPGYGSKFALYFPRYLGDDIDKATEASDDVIDLSGTENILIVDDEASLRDLASTLLSQQGYRVFCAENGKQALRILKREHIDLMLSDVIMPSMDGYQLASVVQKKYPSIKIQLASGFSQTLNMDMLGESLHQNLLYKPYESRALFKNVRVLLDK